MAQPLTEWIELTWYPVTGCSKVSQRCKFCYAEVMAAASRPWVLRNTGKVLT